MKVLYFAEIKDILQKAQEDIVLEPALTVQQFEDLLFERYPQINNKKFQVAVNEEFEFLALVDVYFHFSLVLKPLLIFE
nr:MoaD/ThiS family protein [Staphylococcus aureus]